MRNYSVDSIRVIAIIAVILLHMDALEPLATDTTVFTAFRTMLRFAVPFFFAAAAYFFARKLRREADRQAVLAGYARRLLLIYACWVVIYRLDLPGLIRLLLDSSSIQSFYWGFIALYKHALAPITENFVAFLLSGGIYHLWFLPALLLGLLAVTLAIIHARERQLLWLALALYLFDATLLHWQLAGHFTAVLACAVGLYLSTLNHYRSDLAVLLMILGAAINIALVILFGLHDTSPQIASGVGSLLLAAGILMYCLAQPSLGQGSWLPLLGSYTLGVYVSHPLFEQLLSSLWPWNNRGSAFLMAAAIYASALAFSWLASRTPGMRATVT